ncbi:hypothetical protein ACQEVG_32725 [Streptomyces sp. CA-135486]|uniref:hypothetical protein n=1 Tax=Streptomyces sp. CA-135486 TaxID=3240049 RepID=UPI003D93D2EB
MAPEVLIAVITAVSVLGAAVIAAVPALLALLRRHRGAVEADGTATRDALDSLGALLNARIDDVRDDLDEVREGVARVREWQAGHDAEHLLIGQPRPRPGGES